MTKRFWEHTGIWCLLLLAIAGCGTVPVNAYYNLDNIVKTSIKVSATPVCKKPLGIANVTVVPPYDLTKIVFRPDALEVRYYANHFWVSSPEEMFRKLVARRIDYARIFSDVDNEINLAHSHLSLSISVHNLEEIDKGNSWQARLAMDFLLTDDDSGAFIWRYRFDITRKVDKKEIKEVIVVLNDIYNEEMDKAVLSLQKALARPDLCAPEPE